MDGETLEQFAQDDVLRQKLKCITEKTMNGELDFFESLTQRCAYLNGIPVSHIDKISSNLPYMNGAKELIAELKSRGIKTVCFSGGFDIALEYAQKELGFDEYFGNFLHEKNGILTGQVGGEMMTSDSKGIMLKKLQNIMNISPKETMAVGDGANDLSMFKYAGIRVAFCAKDILKKEATIIIDNKDLREILPQLD